MNFLFSLCHLDNSMLLKDVTDDDIVEIESFIREKLLTILRSKQNTDENSMIDYFGETYAANPEHFKFRIGDKKLLKIIISHVKNVVDSGDVGHFKSKKITSEQLEENQSSNSQHVSRDAASTYYFLNLLKVKADQNANRERGGYRYCEEIKYFATYLRIICGPLAYETLQSNLKCALPSLPSTNRYIQSSNSKVFEGVLRSDELLAYLTSRNLPLKVSISEDSTRIVGRVQYDSTTNQLIGFALPLNKKNGMPVPFVFPARSAEEILSHFSNQNSKSCFINVMMVQPLANVPPFCLLVYGSDNKFTTKSVINRWKYVINKLKRKNIEVITISTDSDPRYNSAMRRLSKLGTSSKIIDFKWFSCGGLNNIGPFFIQDTIHIATKLRNFFLRTILDKKTLPFGGYFIRVAHLVFLLAHFPKDQHQLTETILNPKDKQNFASVQRMFDAKVLDLLKSKVSGSEATVLFLELTRDIIDAFLDLNLSPLQRVRKIWYAVFIFRIWKWSISKNKKYKEDNCLTTNCHSCIEMNAHGLVQLILHSKEINRPDLFLPHLYSSQQCESAFRQLRSFTSTYSTVTNCTTKEALGRISKIQLQNEIMHLTSPNFTYPRLAKKTNFMFSNELPTKEEITNIIIQCKHDAINTAVKLNLMSPGSSKKTKEKATICQIKSTIVQGARKKPKVNSEEEVEVPRIKLTVSDFKNIALKDYSEKINGPIEENSPYVELNFGSKRKVIRKTLLCWYLQDDVMKMSNDRLLRVRSNVQRPTTVEKITSEPKIKSTGKFSVNKKKRPILMYKFKY